MALTSSTVPFSQVAIIRRCSDAQGNFRNAGKRNELVGVAGIDVDERAQAVVLAEIAARLLVARRAVLNVAHGVEADERGLSSVAPQAE